MPLLPMITQKVSTLKGTVGGYLRDTFVSTQKNSHSSYLLSQSQDTPFKYPYRSSVCNFLFSSELQKYRRYEIVMTAYNVIGESPPSAPVEVFVGEAGKRWCENEGTFHMDII